MSKTAPTFETIFTEDYWEEIPPMPKYKSGSQLGRIKEQGDMLRMGLNYFPDDIRPHAEELLCFAANQLVAGEPVTAIQAGEQIGGEKDTEYAIPGAVLLVDRETVNMAARNDVFITGRPDILQGSELEKSAMAAFLSGMTHTRFGKEISAEDIYRNLGFHWFYRIFRPVIERLEPDDNAEPKENYAILNPFNKYHFEPDVGIYKRTVDLFAFLPNMEGETGSIKLSQWRNPPEGPEAYANIVGNKLLVQTGFWPTGAVGETVNISTDAERPAYSRIREAYQCMPGSLEHAKAPTRAKSLSRAGELAVNKA